MSRRPRSVLSTDLLLKPSAIISRITKNRDSDKYDRDSKQGSISEETLRTRIERSGTLQPRPLNYNEERNSDPTRRLSKRIIKVEEKGKRLLYEISRKKEALAKDDSTFLLGIKTPAASVQKVMIPNDKILFDDYRLIYDIANRLHDEATIPEIVLVGTNGTGKSELLEAIIGRPINMVGYSEAGKTKRPLFLHVVSNEAHTIPKCTILQPDKKSEQVALSAIPAEIQKNTNVYFSPDPIHLQYEFAQCINFLIIDTPGLPFDPESEEFIQVENYLSEFLRVPNRLLICVEDADSVERDPSGGTEVIRQYLKKADPGSTRTIHVYNKFRNLSEKFMSAMDCNQYLSKTADSHAFWISLLNSQEHDKAVTDGNFLDLITKLEERDRNLLKAMRADSRFLNNFGLSSVRKYILDWCWNFYYKNEIPKLIKTIQVNKTRLEEEVKFKEEQSNTLNLKKLAVQYAAKFVELSDLLLVGSSKGNPLNNGKTLDEELSGEFYGSSEWDLPIGAKIPFADTKLYGGQQIERLLSEFKIVVHNFEIKESDLSNLPPTSDKKFFSLVCETAQAITEEKLIPIIDQLIERSQIIMKGIPEIVSQVLSSKEYHRQFELSSKHFSPLSAHLKDQFNLAVEKHSQDCKNQCMEEFYSSKTIAWYMSEIFPESELQDESILGKIVDNIKIRIMNNVLGKIYNVLLLPFYRDHLWEEIQTHLYQLDEFTLEEIFDHNSIREHLDHELDQLRTALEIIEEEETTLKKIVPGLPKA